MERYYKEAEYAINYALNKIQQEYRNVKINPVVLNKILKDYLNCCAGFKGGFVIGELDSFEKAACLMCSINRNKVLFYGDNQIVDLGKYLFLDKYKDEMDYKPNNFLKAELAIDAALKLCEDPICYVGENFNEEKKLKKFKYKEYEEKYSEKWKKIKHELFVMSYSSEGRTTEAIYIYLVLKYLYKYVNNKLRASDYEQALEDNHEFFDTQQKMNGTSFKKRRK